MARNFDLIVFDWDGTLFDSTGAIVAAVQAACHDLGEPVPSSEHAAQAIGLGLADALRHSVPTLSAERFPMMAERYRHHYLSNDSKLRPFEGVEALLSEVHGYGVLLAVATGKSRVGLTRAMQHSDLGKYFSGWRCADQCPSKPHPQMLEELMDEFAVSPDRTLMIGDTTHDLLTAANAGCAAVAVTYGAHSVEQLDALHPLARCDSVGELATWLRAHA